MKITVQEEEENVSSTCPGTDNLSKNASTGIQWSVGDKWSVKSGSQVPSRYEGAGTQALQYRKSSTNH